MIVGDDHILAKIEASEDETELVEEKRNNDELINSIRQQWII